jgi:hypothetical protein
MFYAPICITAYNRPEHLKKTVDSLRDNYLAEKSELFILSNAAITSEDEKNVNDIREYASHITGFKRVTLIKNAVNRGETEHVVKNFTHIINTYKRLISLDDDIVTTRNFLNYMNDSLQYYENNKSIFSIGGFSLPIISDACSNNHVYFLPRPCSWGWATWVDRWMSIQWNISKEDLKKVNWFQFNMAGYDLYNMLKEYVAGRTDAYDIAWQYTMYIHKYVTVHPKEGFVTNIGMDGSGERCGKTDRYTPVLINDNKIDFQFTDKIVFDKKILTYFRKYWGKSFSAFGNLLIYYIGYRFPFLFTLYYHFKNSKNK